MRNAIILLITHSAISAPLFAEGTRILPDKQSLRPEVSTYHLTCDVSSTIGDGPNADTTKLNIEVWYRLAGEKQRVDFRYLEGTSDSNQAGRHETICSGCGFDKIFSISRALARTTPVMFYGKSDFSNSLFFDWMKLGILGDELGQYHKTPWSTTYDHFSNPNLSFYSLSRRASSDRVVIRLDRKDGRGYAECEVGNNHAGNPSKYTFKSTDESGKIAEFESTTTIQIERHLAGKREYHYPKKIEYARFRDGNIIIKESISVSIFEVDVPIADSIFTLAGLGLPNGTPVNISGQRDLLKSPTIQDGAIAYDKPVSSIVAADQVIAPKPDVPPPSFWSRSWPYFAGAVFLAGVGFFLLRRMKKPSA